jgi:hypothetical protein
VSLLADVCQYRHDVCRICLQLRDRHLFDTQMHDRTGGWHCLLPFGSNIVHCGGDGLPVLLAAGSLSLCPNLLHLKHATRVRRSSNGNAIIPPPPKVTLSDLSRFPASSFVATLRTTTAYCLLGIGHLSHLIVHTSTPKRSMADLCNSPLSISIASGTFI